MKLDKSRRGRLRPVRRQEDFSPMEGVGNMADAMLVFACGLLLALIMSWNVDVSETGIIGENPNGIPNNLFPYIAKVACGQLPRLSVFGNDYDTPDGTGVRDYIHVVDLAIGHLKALNWAMNETGVEAINLGTGKGTSVLELVSAFERASGVKIPYQITERRPGDIGTCYADTQKAKDLLGWEAKYTIEDMCRDGWRYIQK